LSNCSQHGLCYVTCDLACTFSIMGVIVVPDMLWVA
jgi:hypothetical protein